MVSLFQGDSRKGLLPNIPLTLESQLIRKHLYRHQSSVVAMTSQNNRVYSIDKKLSLKVFDFKKSELIFDGNLVEMKGFPVSMAYFDPFNLGYMYLLKAHGKTVAFTCDMGTLVFTIDIPLTN